MSNAKLKTCPCCGGIAIIRSHNYLTRVSRVYWVECSYCELRTTEYNSMDEAEKAWNMRV